MNDAELVVFLAGMHLASVVTGGALLWRAWRSGGGEDPEDGSDEGGGGGNDRSPSRRPLGGPPLPDAEPAGLRLRQRAGGLGTSPRGRRGCPHRPAERRRVTRAS